MPSSSTKKASGDSSSTDGLFRCLIASSRNSLGSGVDGNPDLVRHPTLKNPASSIPPCGREGGREGGGALSIFLFPEEVDGGFDGSVQWGMDRAVVPSLGVSGASM